MLSELNPDKVCVLIVKFREFGVQAEPNLGGGSDASDDNFVAVFDNEANPSVVEEAKGLIAAMNSDDRLLLTLHGRRDGPQLRLAAFASERSDRLSREVVGRQPGR